jgi:hypothetical protein
MSQTYTSGILGLSKFANGDTGWGAAVNGNFDAIDTALTQRNVVKIFDDDISIGASSFLVIPNVDGNVDRMYEMYLMGVSTVTAANQSTRVGLVVNGVTTYSAVNLYANQNPTSSGVVDQTAANMYLYSTAPSAVGTKWTVVAKTLFFAKTINNMARIMQVHNFTYASGVSSGEDYRTWVYDDSTTNISTMSLITDSHGSLNGHLIIYAHR